MNSTRSFRPALPARSLGIGLALIMIVSPLAAGGNALKTARGDILLPGPDGKVLVESPGGGRLELPLPKSARVSDLRSSATGWFAAAVVREDGVASLRLFESKAGALETLAAPVQKAASELGQPVFVADADGVKALLWFAGEAHNQHEVRVAEWLDGYWGETKTISPPGKGTQIALSTAVLGDGSWLAVWAAFDGQDDEILWSRHVDGAWSKPRQIAQNNAVPDITPALYPTAGGALAVWSRYDGNDYRVNLSRFDGKRWSAPVIVGGRGSTAPSFSDAGKPYLIYRRADPAAWGVMELDGAGKVLREAALELADPRRPLLFEASESTVTLGWATVETKSLIAPLTWTER